MPEFLSHQPPRPEDMASSINQTEDQSSSVQAEAHQAEAPDMPRTEHGFLTNYAEVFFQEALDYRENNKDEGLSPEEAEDLHQLIAEIDRQMVENLDIVESTKFSGVSYTHTKISITPETINRIYGRQDQNQELSLDQPAEEQQEPTRHTIVQFGSFGIPPEGHALSMGDQIIDRAIRESSLVSNRMDSQQPAEVTIEVLGSPTGFGGAVTPEWGDAIKQQGQQAYVELYSEYLNQNVLPDLDHKTAEQQQQLMQNQQLTFQGTSRGAIIAYKLGQAMPEEVQKNLSILMDNPAGHHKDEKFRWLKGLKLPVGLVGEFLGRAVFDDTLKSLMAGDNQRVQVMSQKLNLLDREDQADQDKMKQSITLSEGLGLISGQSLEGQSMRAYIRWATEDPLRLNGLRKLKLLHKKFDSLAGLQDREHGIRAYAHRGTHFFSPYKNYRRWRTINKANRKRYDLAQLEQELQV